MAEPDTILVLGGPAAGKTVYVSVLYHHLWKCSDGMLMRAGSGAMHTELLGAVESLLEGTMPPATQALRHYEFELEHAGRMYQLRYLDYPGELFRKAFYELSVDTDEVRELLSACEKATGVLVLVDPNSVIENGDEVDYALSNLLRFYESKKSSPKFVIAFTKRDETQKMVGKHLTEFLRKRLPHVRRLLGAGVRMMHFCSIIKSDHAVQLARADVVRAPLESILDAIQGEQIDRSRARFMRRLAVRDALKKALYFLGIFVVLLIAFALGVYLRSLVGPSSGMPPLPETG